MAENSRESEAAETLSLLGVPPPRDVPTMQTKSCKNVFKKLMKDFFETEGRVKKIRSEVKKNTKEAHEEIRQATEVIRKAKEYITNAEADYEAENAKFSSVRGKCQEYLA